MSRKYLTVVLSALLLAGAGAWLMLHGSLSTSAAPPKSPSTQARAPEVIEGVDTNSWMPRLASGREVEFRTPAASTTSSDSLGVTRTIQLNAEQKAVALKSVTNFRDAAEQRYRNTSIGSYADQKQSLEEGYKLVLYDAAVAALNEGTAWSFVQGSEEYKVAWRNVPRDWKKTSFHGVAATAEGRPIDIIVAIDPKQNAAVASMLEQIYALGEQKPSILTSEFNRLPEPQRIARIQRHKDALALLNGTPKPDRETRRRLESDLIDDSLYIDDKKHIVLPR